MADLVRDHVGLRELARPATVAAAKACRNLIEERRVEVDLLIGRAVEWSHSALRDFAATGLLGAAVENQLGCAVGLAGLVEDLFPLHFSAAEQLTRLRSDSSEPGSLAFSFELR